MVDTMSALESSVLKNVPVEIMQSIFEYINASDDEVYGRGVGMQSLGAALTCRDFNVFQNSAFARLPWRMVKQGTVTELDEDGNPVPDSRGGFRQVPRLVRQAEMTFDPPLRVNEVLIWRDLNEAHRCVVDNVGNTQFWRQVKVILLDFTEDHVLGTFRGPLLSDPSRGQEGHDQDITSYVNNHLRIGNSNLANQIKVELQEKASGVFMWVVLVVDMLNKEHDQGRSPRRLQKKLQDVPGDLHNLFHDILTRDSRDRHEQLLCIQWLLFVRQPLQPEQLYYAILSGTEPRDLLKWDPDETSMDVIKRSILNSSKGLAEITKSKIPSVQFIHESVRDFLLKENGLRDIWSEQLGSNFQGESHEQLPP